MCHDTSHRPHCSSLRFGCVWMSLSWHVWHGREQSRQYQWPLGTNPSLRCLTWHPLPHALHSSITLPIFLAVSALFAMQKAVCACGCGWVYMYCTWAWVGVYALQMGVGGCICTANGCGWVYMHCKWVWVGVYALQMGVGGCICTANGCKEHRTCSSTAPPHARNTTDPPSSTGVGGRLPVHAHILPSAEFSSRRAVGAISALIAMAGHKFGADRPGSPAICGATALRSKR
jgi:hypothetical protein